MTRTKKISLFAFLAMLPLLMAPSGGFTSRPQFQQETISTASSNNIIRLFAQGAAADVKNTLIRSNSSGTFVIDSASDAAPTTPVNSVITATRSGTSFASVNLSATAVQVNSVSLPMTYSITFSTGTNTLTNSTANASTFTVTSCATGTCTITMTGVDCSSLRCYPVCATSATNAMAATGVASTNGNPGSFVVNTVNPSTLAAANASAQCIITRG